MAAGELKQHSRASQWVEPLLIVPPEPVFGLLKALFCLLLIHAASFASGGMVIARVLSSGLG